MVNAAKAKQEARKKELEERKAALDKAKNEFEETKKAHACAQARFEEMEKQICSEAKKVAMEEKDIESCGCAINAPCAAKPSSVSEHKGSSKCSAKSSAHHQKCKICKAASTAEPDCTCADIAEMEKDINALEKELAAV